jgi:acyl-coenzyme A synthetase/AMP-(fatty) acid ligase
VEFPPLDLIVSATAPLTLELAREVESKYQTSLLEIYGSTETARLQAVVPPSRMCGGSGRAYGSRFRGIGSSRMVGTSSK